ncbi:hypothetical protein RIF29_28914 [Crotalaria pallida]|uniref:Uncharacterized protein n=1 Tax=Crotalaria pallida TaxID=3830 RepID=A0AAN9HTE4_CROPI
MNLLMYMAPVAVAFLLPASIIMKEDVVAITFELCRDDPKMMWLLIFNSALAYFVNLTNFLVTKHTSALTLQILSKADNNIVFMNFQILSKADNNIVMEAVDPEVSVTCIDLFMLRMIWVELN